MEKFSRVRYTLKYKQEAVRLLSSGQRAQAAKPLGIVEQTLANRVKAEEAGQLRGVESMAAVGGRDAKTSLAGASRTVPPRRKLEPLGQAHRWTSVAATRGAVHRYYRRAASALD